MKKLLYLQILILFGLSISSCSKLYRQTLIDKGNLFSVIPNFSKEEFFKDIENVDGVRVEKIISYGQTTPKDQPYLQSYNEWLMILSGEAKLKLGDKEYHLFKGDYLLVPKGIKHWVTYTKNPTIWLTVHINE